MKKIRPDQKRNFFRGICNGCGEIYEASSVVDDLEGLSFNCKKNVCSGRVTMNTGKNNGVRSLQVAPVEDENLFGDHPRRFC
jgi:hypothetical protein